MALWPLSFSTSQPVEFPIAADALMNRADEVGRADGKSASGNDEVSRSIAEVRRDHGVGIQDSLKLSTPVISSIDDSQRFFRCGRWPDRTWQARTSQMTRVEMRLVISAAS